MNPEEFDHLDADWELAITARLAKLRTVPVDTSTLDKAVRQQVPSLRKIRPALWLRPLRAVAASVVLLGALTAAILLSTSGGPALAEATQMAQVHRDIVSGRIPVMQVRSVEDANRMLISQSPDAPSLPQMPQSHVMACCMKSIHNKKVACVLLKEAGVPITLAVANASDMKLPNAPTVDRDGAAYRVQTVGNVHMVMTERDGKWLCLMSELPADRLMDLATQVRF